MKRRCLGFIIPSANTVMEPEIYANLPEGVSAHFSRAYLERDDVEQLKGLRTEAIRCVRELLSARVHLIAFGCTTGSLVEGREYETGLLKDLRRAGAPLAVSTASAVIDALHACGAKVVSVAAPYEAWLTQRVADYLEGFGFQVPETRCLGIMDHRQAEVTDSLVYQLALEADHPAADALFISCTNFPTQAVLAKLRRDLGKPVISSNSATLWRSLDLLGIPSAILS